MKTSAVYFAEDRSRHLIKIGYSANPHYRITRQGLKLIGWIPGSKKEEGSIHRRFRAYRWTTRGEYFRDVRAIRSFVKKHGSISLDGFVPSHSNLILWIPVELHERLRARAKKEGRRLSVVAMRILDRALTPA